MSKTLRFTAAASGAVALFLLLFTPIIAAPAPAEPAITATDVKSLQEAIKSLHARFEAQGKILEKSGDDLGTLTKRVDDYLKPSTLEPMQSGLAAVVKKLGDLNAAMGKLADAQEKQTAEAATQFKETSAALARLQVELEKVGSAAGTTNASIGQLRTDLTDSANKVSSAPVPLEKPSPLLPLLGAIAAATMVLAILIYIHGGAQRRAQAATHAQLTSALAQTREALLAEIQARTSATAVVAATGTTETSPGAADGLAEIRAKLQSVLDHLNLAAPPVHNDDHTTKKFTETPADDQTTDRNPLAPGAGIPSASCWPAVFLDTASPLAVWRERIESHLASKDHPSLPVFSAFLALRALCVRQPAPSLAEVGGAVVALSQTLYTYWENLPGLTDDDRAKASSDWIQAVKALTSTAAPKLEIREIIAGARFDSDSMQTVQEGSGNHLIVAAVFSWATLDKSGERVKILQRARIATN